MLLGFVIHKASGKFYGDLLKERVFGPLGMTTAQVISESDIVRHESEDLADAMRDAADWAREVRRRMGLSQAGFSRRIGVPVAKVREWERGFHEFMAAKVLQVGEGIRNSKALSKDLEGTLRQAIEDYKKIATVAKPAGITKKDL